MPKICHSAHIKRRALSVMALLLLELCAFSAKAQVNSGSDGSDGVFNPTQNVTIDMSDHPDGIYQYTSVNVPSGVTVTFIPNAQNTSVVWLVQGDVAIGGQINLSGQSPQGDTWTSGASGGPGGFPGGSGGLMPQSGGGPGGGTVNSSQSLGGNASYGTVGQTRQSDTSQYPAGIVYSNDFLLPMLGGSGGSGSGNAGSGSSGSGGGGGGGAILVAASGKITLNGQIYSQGGSSSWAYRGGGGGSGGAVRLVATTVEGSGGIYTDGGSMYYYWNYPQGDTAGNGRVRVDALSNSFGGSVTGVFTQGFQPVIIPAPGQGVQLSIVTVGGTTVRGNPSGILTNPDIIIPGQQSNPIPIVVSCTNIPLNTAITVVAHPANGTDIQAVGVNNVGTATSSTATMSMNLPQGGGILYADCLSGTTTK